MYNVLMINALVEKLMHAFVCPPETFSVCKLMYPVLTRDKTFLTCATKQLTNGHTVSGYLYHMKKKVIIPMYVS